MSSLRGRNILFADADNEALWLSEGLAKQGCCVTSTRFAGQLLDSLLGGKVDAVVIVAGLLEDCGELPFSVGPSLLQYSGLAILTYARERGSKIPAVVIVPDGTCDDVMDVPRLPEVHNFFIHDDLREVCKSMILRRLSELLVR